jgi:hypothetical protein
MSNASPTVFIAYARTDIPRVEPIAATLRQRGYTVIFDPSSAHGGGNYVQASQEALRKADALIVCWSQAAAASPWIASETRAFQSQMARGGGRKLIPVWLDATPLPPELASYNAVDGWTSTPATIADMLTPALGATTPAPAPAPTPAAPASAPQDAPTNPIREADYGVALPTPSVFITFARSDQPQAEAIATRLRESGYHVAFDASGAPGRGDYVQASQQALRDATILVVCWSKAAAQSPWVESEVRAFQTKRVRGVEAKFALALLDDTPLSHELAELVDHGGIDISGSGLAPDALGIEVASIISAADGMAAPAPADIMPSAGASATDWEFEAERSASSDYDEEVDNEPTTGALTPLPPDGSERDATSVPPPAPAPEAPAEAAPPPAPVPAAPPPFVDPGVIGSVAAPPIYEPPMPTAPEPGYVAPQPTPQPITQPRGKGATTGAPAPFSGSLEQVTFTAYHPRETQPQQWQPMVVYLSLDTPAALAQVGGLAAERLGGKLSDYRPGRSERSAGMQRGTKLRIVPSAPGFQFNPDVLDVTWQEDVQQHEFRMRAETAQPGQSVNGVVQFYQGMILRGEVPISMFVGQAMARLDSPDAYQQAIARAYRHIFASYSHQDMPVVESCESAARSMGDQYLRDVTLLQSGQQWDPRLIQAINDADIFQLFWSRRAAASQFVEREWRHALMLLPARPNFIRPVYWSRQLYATPPELNPLHFQPLSLSSLGWGKLRAAWYNMRNG